MLTPRDIQETGFSKAVFGGYDTDSVDDFLEIVAEDYAKLYKDNAVLKSKIKVLVDKIEEYRQTEDSMRSTLLAAQKKSEDLLNEAKTKSSDILAGAAAEAESKLADLGSRMEFESVRLADAQAETQSFMKSARELISSYTAFLDDIEAREFPELNVEAAEEAEAEQSLVGSDDSENAPAGDEASEAADEAEASPVEAEEVITAVEAAIEAAEKELADAAESTAEETAEAAQKADLPAEEIDEVVEAAAEESMEVADAAEDIVEDAAEAITEGLDKAVETAETVSEALESTAEEIIGSISDGSAENVAEDAVEVVAEADDLPPFDLFDAGDEELKVYTPKAQQPEIENGIFEVDEAALPEDELLEGDAEAGQLLEEPEPAAKPEPRPKKHFEYDLPLDDIRPEDIKDVLADDEPEKPDEQDEAALYAATMRLFYEDDDTRSPRPKFDFDDLQFGSNYDPNK